MPVLWAFEENSEHTHYEFVNKDEKGKSDSMIPRQEKSVLDFVKKRCLFEENAHDESMNESDSRSISESIDSASETFKKHVLPLCFGLDKWHRDAIYFALH